MSYESTSEPQFKWLSDADEKIGPNPPLRCPFSAEHYKLGQLQLSVSFIHRAYNDRLACRYINGHTNQRAAESGRAQDRTIILRLFFQMTDEDQKRIALALRAAVAGQQEVHSTHVSG